CNDTTEAESLASPNMIYQCMSWRTIHTGSTYLGSTNKYQDSRADFSSTTEDGFGSLFEIQIHRSRSSIRGQQIGRKVDNYILPSTIYTSPSHHTPLSSLASISIEAKNLLAN
ncbi:MAG: hypothetical protein WBL54_06430, partial [Nitrososphaeraceae archaeon]